MSSKLNLSSLSAAVVLSSLALLVAPAASENMPRSPRVPAGKKQAALQAPAPPMKPGTPRRSNVSVAPLPADQAKEEHAAFDASDCSICHEREDPKDPGKLSQSVNDTCAECHDDMLANEYGHEAAAVACTNCHNPHNARRAKLLVKEIGALCTTCHTDIQDLTETATVKHGALSVGDKCVNCHDPHSTNVEHLLKELPYDLCIGCHSNDEVKDGDGHALTNFKRLLDDNPVHHAPVAAKDCSACHRPHGSSNFRLLDSRYPAEFYASWSAENYDICFQCHDEEAFEQERTVTLTQFRDGARNLHYVHVHREARGRTCRACHEVHAAKQSGNIRDGVPYGKKGWMLKLNYTRTETGGSCEKTCHAKRTYKNASKKIRRKPGKE